MESGAGAPQFKALREVGRDFSLDLVYYPVFTNYGGPSFAAVQCWAAGTDRRAGSIGPAAARGNRPFFEFSYEAKAKQETGGVGCVGCGQYLDVRRRSNPQGVRSSA